ncbi:MAG: type IV pilus assembly protein PilM [Pirellulales bacterium]|nr:type IV pilus assembly protein PilM [Pirellulales bacterium]
MAKSGAVWGIDIGQCALKALKCRLGDDGKIVAEAFDFIEYPKILSQPEANPAELIAEALKQFLSRNSVRGDQVAISVSGQSGLSRFIKLPPVESKKIPDIVKYEARQQIPFALEDVVWDYERMAGGSEEEGFALETEVGLFAMKRDQAYRAMRPFTEAGIEIDVVQLTPVALYNFVAFDQLHDLPAADQYDPENPPESLIVLSLGTDMSDLVVTNGYRVWQRTINLGGSHFTKALTKQMKLTFAKAEHLKRNAMKAEDPKAVFQAMRPVFNDLLGEVQRSLSFFQNLDRSAKLGRVVALGNAMKLRGLHKYLEQNLGLKVTEFREYAQLTGPGVTAQPAFNENMLSYAVCYGLAVQALGKGKLSTNLLPREIVKDRMIRAKKPWAVAAVAVLLLGCTLGFAGTWREWDANNTQTQEYKSAFGASDAAKDLASRSQSSFESAKTQFEEVRKHGERLASIGDRRILVAELMKAIDESLPRDPDGQRPEKIADRNELRVDSIEWEYFPDLSVWYTDIQELWQKENPTAAPAAVDPNAPADATAAVANPNAQPPMAAAPVPGPTLGPGPSPAPVPPMAGVPSVTGATAPTDATASSSPLSGPGWVIQISGHHFHNGGGREEGGKFVRDTLIASLKEGKFELPDGIFTAKELGIGYPVLVNSDQSIKKWQLVNENVAEVLLNTAEIGGVGSKLGAGLGGAGKAAPNAAAPGAPEEPGKQRVFDELRYDFVVHFCWKPTTLRERLLNRQKLEDAAKAQQPELAAQNGAAPQ